MHINASLDEMVAAMALYEKDFQMKLYPGAPHAFFDDTNKTACGEEAAKDAWDRTLQFFGHSLCQASRSRTSASA